MEFFLERIFKVGENEIRGGTSGPGECDIREVDKTESGKLILIMAFVLSVTLSLPLHAQESGEEVAGVDSVESTRLVDVDYRELQKVINSYQGTKAVLLNIWATWCGPCVEELPHIKKLQEKYPEKLQVVLLSADMKSDRSRVVPFLRERDIRWTTYFKSGDNQRFLNRLSDQWSGALPFTKILNKEGEVVEQWQGSADFEKFHTHVKKAIEDQYENP